MAAVNVTNKHTTALPVGGVTIGPGRTAAVSRWDVVKRTENVASWLKAGVLEVAGVTPRPQAAEVVNDPDVLPTRKPVDEMTKAGLLEHARLNAIDIDPTDSKAEILAQVKAAQGE